MIDLKKLEPVFENFTKALALVRAVILPTLIPAFLH
jgi:hypothetical protein